MFGIVQSPKMLSQMRTNIRVPNPNRCVVASLREKAAMRWAQNSGLFPDLESFDTINLRDPHVDFKEVDEIEKIIGEIEDEAPADTTQAQDADIELPGQFTAAEELQLGKSRIEMYAAPSTLKFITGLGDWIWRETQRPLTITALTRSPEHRIDGHCAHLSGYAFDLRPLPGLSPRAVYWSKDKKIYDRAMNEKLVLALIHNANVKQIIFNDGILINDPDVKKALATRAKEGKPPVNYTRKLNQKTHNYHFHVELYPPESLVILAKDLVKLTVNTRLASSKQK